MIGLVELAYPKWQGPLKELVLEFDREKLVEKALDAEKLMLGRLQQLEEASNSDSERKAIGDGLSLLEAIKRERLGTRCKSCGSIKQGKFSAEMGIRFLGLKNIDKPVVWVFPELVVCLDCGTAEFAVPEAQLRHLAKEDAAAAG